MVHKQKSPEDLKEFITSRLTGVIELPQGVSQILARISQGKISVKQVKRLNASIKNADHRGLCRCFAQLRKRDRKGAETLFKNTIESKLSML